MPDELATIQRVKDEHWRIRGHVKVVEDSLSDRETLTALKRAHDDWTPSRPDILVEKQKKLQQTLSLLGTSLKNHFAFEEDALPPLLGELLMRALILEHQEINEQIEQAKLAAADTRLEGLGLEELLSKESHIKEMINVIRQRLEGHANREEVVLEMVERALEYKEGSES